MPKHSETKTLPYTSQQLFDMVSDIEKYPEFLPWCVACRIKDKRNNIITADLIVGYKVIRERFTSKVTLNEPNDILVEYLDGPMKYLHNRWQFRDLGNGQCEVDFFVDFEFKNPLLQSLMGVFFDEIIRRMTRAFEDRAKELYG